MVRCSFSFFPFNQTGSNLWSFRLLELSHSISLMCGTYMMTVTRHGRPDFWKISPSFTVSSYLACVVITIVQVSQGIRIVNALSEVIDSTLPGILHESSYKMLWQIVFCCYLLGYDGVRFRSCLDISHHIADEGNAISMDHHLYCRFLCHGRRGFTQQHFIVLLAHREPMSFHSGKVSCIIA